MSWYRTGTVTVTNNSDVINGAGTDWVSSAKEGETFLGPDNLPYEIAQLISATQLRTRPAYRGPTAAAQSYAIMPTQSYMRDLAAQVSQLINSYAAVRDNAGAGKFAVGALGSPSVRGSADQDTGINFAGEDILEIVAGGVLVARAVPGGLQEPGGERLLSRSMVTAALSAGGVIETGSNANGSFIRYANGYQECRSQVVMPKQNPSASVGWVFPAQFVGGPDILYSIAGASDNTSSQSGVSALARNGIYLQPTASSVVLQSYAYATAHEQPILINVIAKGFWK